MALFEAADPPRLGRIDGRPVGEALPALLHDNGYWGVATAMALQLVARGRIRPGVSPGGHDTWRIGPLDPADEAHLRALSADYDSLRAFLDAVADTLPREPGEGPFAGTEVHDVSGLRDWSDEQLTISLRIETDNEMRFRAIVQHHLTDFDAMLAVRRAARVWAPLERLLARQGLQPLDLTDDEVVDLLRDPPVDVHWPRELLQNLRGRAVISAGEFRLGDTYELNWQLVLGDDPLTEAELDRLAEATRPVVRLRDQWVLVDPAIARQATTRPISAVDALAASLTGSVLIDGVPVSVTREPRDACHASWGSRVTQVEAVPQPAGLAASLRDYQLHGLSWLAHMTSLGLGACLADDMGLGKTITLIALHLHRASGPTLVVCPASLLGNWEREIHRFAPGTPVTRYHGPNRALASEGFVLTTYGTMRLDTEVLAAHEWDMVVADEAQHVKNPASGTAQALRTIPAAARVALSGTPVENNLTELWSILDWTTPGLLGTRRAFRTRWPAPDATLARLIRPFLLRRRKSDPGIAPELPRKTETEQPVSLSPEQAALYEALVREILDQIAAAEGMARRGLILKLLTGLKQICNHPSHYLKRELTGRSGKLELLDELLDTILAEDGSVLVFTQYVDMARLLETHLDRRGIACHFLHGGTPVARRDEMVRSFQAGDVPVFLLSLKAAGTGLNLTRADHVVHYDRWWNPAVEDQATDRAYRIGQTRPVQVHKLVAEGTVEDRVASILAAKRELADAVLVSGESALTELTDAELSELVALRSSS
ncbi:helicase SNF2 [Lentzea sp. NBRC 105346]|uniref:DEAD/DEAH box helicase n=1 Tax=Lentzea sp. NBRC 105346 TaxID=3032205 RepID=UPI0024A206CA|nr:DEAD/DEAH box helicase [Lentzea sp. NBRC 105346]GLZ28270.1 helicase SNF2 [Lentzea sp. NBRC 105346]